MPEKKPRVREVIVVEGRYDRNAVSQAVEALIFETGGFSLFNQPERRRGLQTLARERGVIVLTDSDGAGFVIRKHLKGVLPPDRIRQAFVPTIPGKERRKAQPSKEGLLGVEGMSREVILRALRDAGATFEGEIPNGAEVEIPISTADFYTLGLSGREGSDRLRRKLAESLGLPPGISQSDLRKAIGPMLNREELEKLVLQLTDAEICDTIPGR